MSALHELAAAAGIARHWRDVNGTDQIVADASLASVLGALGLPAETAEEIDHSRELVRGEETGLPPLMTATAGMPCMLPGLMGPYRLTLESGEVIEGRLEGALIAPAAPGYHLLETGVATLTMAVAPARAFTIEQLAGDAKLWGLAVQLYGLRRANGGNIGDYQALAQFATQAVSMGAAAIAISPVHAQFSSRPGRYAPYAPSNRAALNILHVAADAPVSDEALIDWPVDAADRLARLRAAFAAGIDEEGLAAFRAERGEDLENHALFEALCAHFVDLPPDWRAWPDEYASPDSAALRAFAAEHEREIAFHAWAQWQADRGLAAAQAAAKGAGAAIGIIADLAVGTDHGGSQSWSRPDEMLRGLEIGAPPDLINREGQCWGITAFSPRGLVASGYGAFIAMLRASLRHAGGVRIDHVMGLARLWVIPSGRASHEGAYLTMPEEDLIRLVTLESHRHRAIILGEDLGTLPEGFGPRLNEAGIAGLRVMWFERQGEDFTPPALWTPTAVAMTTTHDLPTVTGWWQGQDIAWRHKIGAAGDGIETRAADRAALWAAFTRSGATAQAQPADTDGAAASYAAAAHLGQAACTLALLPIEDAAALPEQPNLPGTTDEHPNWCRRLPADSEALLTRPDVAARLRSLGQMRTRRST
jgi:4-alpha-glucanotransferase